MELKKQSKYITLLFELLDKYDEHRISYDEFQSKKEELDKEWEGLIFI